MDIILDLGEAHTVIVIDFVFSILSGLIIVEQSYGTFKNLNGFIQMSYLQIFILSF